PLMPTLFPHTTLFRSRGLNPFATSVGPLLVLNLIITFGLPGISAGGHVGGLVGGLLGGIVLFGLPRRPVEPSVGREVALLGALGDRKSTRLNSSHVKR